MGVPDRDLGKTEGESNGHLELGKVILELAVTLTQNPDLDPREVLEKLGQEHPQEVEQIQSFIVGVSGILSDNIDLLEDQPSRRKPA